ncbi:MAG: DMT family transporter [Alphaproteobacteria bacterium]|nr:DMT family transporter [Alphaproteobacteria bacterium]MBU0797397.1 DMT family transporter [Alphaproteobacteria bacterium]MBU0887088.1 DMT family transporter [Alphaproteobacteria bacterium]MBU1814338.1 DMT family transporter [Alphaproteobacteria bacterium]
MSEPALPPPDPRRFNARAQSASLAMMPAVFVVLWSTGFVGAKLGLPYVEPMTMLFMRFVITSTLLLPIVLLLRAAWPKREKLKHIALVGLLIQGVYLGGVFLSIHNGLQAGVAALIVSAQPILTAALAGPLLGETVTRRQWLGLVFGIAGVAAVIVEKIGPDSTGGAWASFFAVAALIGITIGTLYQKKHCQGVDIVTGNLLQSITVTIAFGLAAFFFEANVVIWSGEMIFALLWMSIPLSIGATTLFYFMIKRGAASQVASLFYLVPPTTAVMAWLLFGEQFGLYAIIGMVLVAIGILLIRMKPGAP